MAGVLRMQKDISTVEATAPIPNKLRERFSLSLWLWTVIPLLVSNGLFIPLWLAGKHVEVENGPMENLHGSFLLLGCVVIFSSLGRFAGGERILRAGLGLFFLNFVVREVDLRAYDLPTVNFLIRGWFRNSWLAGFWLLGALWFLRHRVAVWQAFRDWSPTAAARLLVVAGVIWVLSTGAEKLHLIQPPDRGLFVEELLETNACWLMLVAAVLIRRKPPAVRN